MPKRLLSLAVLCLAGRAVAAEPPPPLTVPDLVGPRTLSLAGAGVGLSAGNESLFLNPAALAARKRYVADTFFLTDRRSGVSDPEGRQDYLGGAVTDSSSTAVAAGLAYVRAMRGVETGTLLRLGLATSLSQGFSVGAQVNYFNLTGAEKVSSAFNVDAGIFYQVTRLVSIGGSAYNLLKSSHRQLLPRGFGAGFAAGSETSFQVVGDWRLDLDRPQPGTGKTRTNRYSLGAEYLFAGAVPLRAGFQVDDTSKTRWWSAGVGYASGRVGLDLAYRQSTTDRKARTYGIALRVLVPNE